MAYTASKLLEIARGELGYKEKETNSQLDNPTANAGGGIDHHSAQLSSVDCLFH